jgi:hypothetical protein
MISRNASDSTKALLQQTAFGAKTNELRDVAPLCQMVEYLIFIQRHGFLPRQRRRHFRRKRRQITDNPIEKLLIIRKATPDSGLFTTRLSGLL